MEALIELHFKLVAALKSSFTRSIYHQIRWESRLIGIKKYLFEIGGKGKNVSLSESQQVYVAADDIEIGFGNKIPLWPFGFLYLYDFLLSDMAEYLPGIFHAGNVIQKTCAGIKIIPTGQYPDHNPSGSGCQK